MIYKISFKEGVEQDLKELSKSDQILVSKQFKKISKSPELGKPLGNKNGYNLAGYRKMYAKNKKIRIVYTIVEDIVVVEVVAVGKRDDMEVYAKAFGRIK